MGVDHLAATAFALEGISKFRAGRAKSSQLQEQSRLSAMQEADMKAQAMENQWIEQAANRARAAASGINPRKSRSFLAFMDENERKYQRDIRAIGVTGRSKRKLYAMQGSAARRGGMMGGGVSLIKAAGKLV
jgi:hypothetical protein